MLGIYGAEDGIDLYADRGDFPENLRLTAAIVALDLSGNESRLVSEFWVPNETVGERCEDGADCQGRSWCGPGSLDWPRMCRQSLPGRWRLTVVEGEVEEFRADGSPWDEDGDRLPDPMAQFILPDQSRHNSPIDMGSFYPEWDYTIEADLKPNDVLGVCVNEMDADGRFERVHCIGLTGIEVDEVYQSGGERTWNFNPAVDGGRLNSLTLRFEPTL